MNISDIFQSLLPNGQPFLLSSGKNITKLFDAISGVFSDAKKEIDKTELDLYPQTTRFLDEFERQFGLTPGNLTTQQRRDRLAAEWAVFDGQSPYFIQKIIQAYGFDVYAYDWWDDNSTQGNVIVKNPFSYIADSKNPSSPLTGCGIDNMVCGNKYAYCGRRSSANGYLLVNKDREYNIPTDKKYWSSIIYFGGKNWGDLATIPFSRKEEFEDLLLRICPTEKWIGVLVRYA